MDSPLAIDVSSPIIRRSKHFFQESKDELITSLINKNEVISINDSFTTNSNSNNNMIFPIVRCNVLGKGSSSTVYKSVMLNSLSVCAEKVISVTDPNKKSQVLRELELLRSMVNTTICKPNSNSNSYSTNTINSNSYSNYTTSNSASDSNYTESSNSYSYGRSTDMDVTPTREIIENTKNCNENDKDISPDTITSTNSDPTNSSNINNNSTSNSASTSTSNSTNDNSAMSFLCPYVVNLLDVIPNPIDGTLSICLEYMDGGSLLDLVKAGGCQNEKELVSLTYQLLSGLKYLHDKRLIHRDIKPSNALISTTGKVKLADFGLTRVLDLGNSLADSFVGTFDFMAPVST